MVKIKEVKLKIKTLNKVFVEETTSTINGYLESVIVNSTKGPVNFSIAFDKFPDIKILESNKCVGQKYFALRSETTSDDSKGFPHTQDKWAINDKLLISVEGLKVDVEFIFRFT